MAKGKQAALAANRRLEAAHAHIDRLTSELVDAKLRAKQAELRAARLEGADQLVSAASVKHDEMLADALAALSRWTTIQKQDQKRRNEAMTELLVKVLNDVGVKDLVNLPLVDRWELARTRYPALASALMARDDAGRKPGAKTNAIHPVEMVHAQRKLEGDDLRRFQRLCGMRAVMEPAPERDAADVWNDMLDAKQIGLSFDEMMMASPSS